MQGSPRFAARRLRSKQIAPRLPVPLALPAAAVESAVVEASHSLAAPHPRRRTTTSWTRSWSRLPASSASRRRESARRSVRTTPSSMLAKASRASSQVLASRSKRAVIVARPRTTPRTGHLRLLESRLKPGSSTTLSCSRSRTRSKRKTLAKTTRRASSRRRTCRFGS